MSVLPTVQVLIFLLPVIAAVAVVATRLKIPPSILLVLTGVVLALIPGLPEVQLAPELVLLLVLPPLIYDSAVSMSWREFRFNLRPISLLVVGCVLFTAVAIAAAGHLLLGLSWPVGFILGAIVSPPDAVAPLSIMRRMKLPRRITIILEGEGIANDATALILYRFAIVAASAGAFSASAAVGTFAIIVAGEIAWGIGVGWTMLRLRRWVRDPRIEITLSVLTPFVAYWPPQHLGGSGVLATVTAGLYISWNGLRLISAATRLQGIFFWDFVIYLIEGLVFLMTGLEARAIAAGVRGHSVAELALASALVCAVVVGARFIWMYPATYLPRWLLPRVRRRDPSPPWQWPFILAFTGVRGIVSLAAALAIPLTTASGAPFPDRDLIIILTFAVILVTLVVPGLSLPWVVRWLGLANAGHRERHAERQEEATAWRQAIETALAHLDRMASERSLSDEIVNPLRVHYRDRLHQVETRSDGNERHRKLIELGDDIALEAIDIERGLINDLYYQGKIKDESRRRIERALDLREADIRNQRAED